MAAACCCCCCSLQEVFKACLEQVRTIPQFYQIHEMTSLTGGTFNPGLKLTFEKQLLIMVKYFSSPIVRQWQISLLQVKVEEWKCRISVLPLIHPPHYHICTLLFLQGNVDITDHKIVPADALLASDYHSVSSLTPPATKAKDVHAVSK